MSARTFATAPLAALAMFAAGTGAASAQVAPATPVAAAPRPADPARDAAAQRVALKLLPPGTYRRVMRDMFPAMMDAIMGSMSSLRSADLGVPDKDGKTLGESATERDPAFRERMAIMTRIMGEEFAPIMDKLEPNVRTALGRAFAGRFTLAQLNDLDAFLATPSGTAFGDNFMAAFMDPEMMKQSSTMMPEIIKVMPRIMARMKTETAHLGPEPTAGSSEPVTVPAPE